MSNECLKCHTENPTHAKYCRGCGKKFDEGPEILNFQLNAVCRVGDVIDLSWDISNADKVTLNGRDVTDITSLSVTITGDEIFNLVATKDNHIVEKTINVHPQKPSYPKPYLPSFVSALKCKKWTALIGLLALAILIIVLFDENIIPSYFNIGYSGWQNAKPIIIILCCVILTLSIGSIIHSKIKNIQK